MATYIRTLCFHSSGMKFESEKDDRVINEALQELQSQGAKIEEITVRLVPVGVTITALYLIEYEAPSEL